LKERHTDKQNARSQKSPFYVLQNKGSRLIYTLKKYDRGMWIGLVWLRIGTGGGLLLEL
jgi:hypothetical protein